MHIETNYSDVALPEVINTNLFDFEKASQAPGWLKEMRGEHIPETEEYNISSISFKSKKPFQHVQQPENKSKATEVLLSRSGLGKSAMFTMTFSPGNGHTSNFNKYANHNNTTAETTIEEPSVTDEDTNNNTSSIRLEDLAISQTGKEDTAADEEAEKEEAAAPKKN